MLDIDAVFMYAMLCVCYVCMIGKGDGSWHWNWWSQDTCRLFSHRQSTHANTWCIPWWPSRV